MAEHLINGKLADWNEVRDYPHNWSLLLVGNGLSMNIWPGFGYSSLFEEAQRIDAASGGLEDQDRHLFATLRTENFELVLESLNTAIRVAEALGLDASPYYERYRRVQVALAAAVRAVHIDRIEGPNDALEAIRAELRTFKRVFSTSYDLIVYWSMGYGESFDGFCDCFIYGSFDPQRADDRPGKTSVYFPHGALHLVVHGSGRTHKRSRGAQTLLEQFGQPIPEDPRARPLLISEGSHHDKQLAIDGNDYLAHAHAQLRSSDQPLVIFGHGLEDQDEHLIAAINAHPDRPVAVSARPRGRSKVRKYQSHVRGKLETEELYFFNSTTHPLGGEQMTKERRAPWRRRVGRITSRVASGIARTF